MVNHKPTQNERIIRYMEYFGSITQVEALQDLGVMRLASRISDSFVQDVNRKREARCLPFVIQSSLNPYAQRS